MNTRGRIRKLVNAVPPGRDVYEVIGERAIELCNRWNHTFHLDGGDRGLAMEHDAHLRSVGASPDALLLNRQWRAAISLLSGWTFVTSRGGKHEAVRFDPSTLDPQALLREIERDAARWKAASRHDVGSCESCRDAMHKTRRARVFDA